MTSSALTPVIVVSTYYPPVLGGAETAAVQLAEFLAAQGRRVTVLTKRTGHDVPDTETRNGVEVVRVSPRGPRTTWGKWLALPALTRELLRRRAEAGAVVCVDYRGIALAAMTARLVTGRPVILHAQTDGVISFGAVTRVLGRVGLGRAARWIVRPLRHLYSHADAYPCISHAIEAETLDAGVPADRVHYLPNPVDTTQFTPVPPAERAALRARLGIPAGAKVAIVVGRLSREKGQLEALEAWKAAALPDGVLVLVGPDMTGNAWDIGPEARRFVQREQLDARVTFTGGVKQAAIPDYLRAADLSIQPSHFEAFGTAAIEAMAAGLPVVASDVGGLKDFVMPGVNGIRVPPRDPAALARAVTSLLTDDAERLRLAAGARQTALDFDLARVLGRHADLIDALAARRGHLAANS